MYNTLNSRFYHFQQTTAVKHTDEICLKTSFPWILQADSSLIMIWESIIAVISILVGIIYPYIIGFKKELDRYLTIFSGVVDVAFFADVFLQTFTAVETDAGTV